MELKLKNEISSDLSIREVVLNNRGIINFQDYLNCSEDKIKDYKELEVKDNFKKGLNVLSKALKNKEKKIYILVDCDVDGFSSSAILANYLFRTGIKSVGKIDFGFHEDKSHGLEKHMSKILEGEYDLVISPDGGSSDFEYHKILKDKGINTLIIDHHDVELEEDYDNAIIINNNMIINGEKIKANHQISGAGVVFKFCQYIDKMAKAKLSNGLEDLVSLGLVSDMMEITNIETKQMIFKGLKNGHIKNKFMRKVIDSGEKQFKNGKMKPSFKNNLEIVPNSIGWHIAPKINSVCRCSTIDEKRQVFYGLLEEFNGDEEVVTNALKIANRAVRRQRKEVGELMEEVVQVEVDEYLENNPTANFIILTSDDKEKIKSVYRGLLANKIAGNYSLPCMILTLGEDEDGKITYSGSARGCIKKISSFKKVVGSCSAIDYVQGHDNAFGVSVPADKLKDFKKQLSEALSEEEGRVKENFVDFLWTERSKELTETNILELQSLNDYVGFGFEEVEIGLELDLAKCEICNFEKITKIIIPQKNIEIIAFGERFKEKLPEGSRSHVACLCVPGRNEYLGNIKGQLIVKDVETKEKTTPQADSDDLFEAWGI